MKKFDYYIGIDVSKLTLDVTIVEKCNDINKSIHYKIENNKKSISEFVKQRLGSYPCEEILFCFEDTGIYSLPLAYYLNENNLTYWKVAPIEIKRSKGISRGKSDKSDSKDIAFYALANTHKFRQSNMSVRSIQQLDLLFTEREKVLKALSSFERTSEGKDFISKEVLATVTSINRTMINQLKKAKKHIEDKMLAIVSEEEHLNQQYKLLTSIPGIGMQTAIYLIIVSKGFESFDNWRQLACYAGVAPFPYQSGTSIQGRTKVHPMADRKLKSLLNMCALVAVRHDKELKTYYERKVKEGKNKMLVVNNVRCKLLSRVFAVINRKTPFINTQKFAA
jgi:transposase